MIDKMYITCARNIRSEFLRLSTQLENYKKDLSGLATYLQEASTELEEFAATQVKNIKNQSDIQVVSDHIIKKFNEIEAKEQQILKLITPINDRIEKLRVEEINLFDQLKENYPSLSDEAIIKEIQSNLEK